MFIKMCIIHSTTHNYEIMRNTLEPDKEPVSLRWKDLKKKYQVQKILLILTIRVKFNFHCNICIKTLMFNI